MASIPLVEDVPVVPEPTIAILFGGAVLILALIVALELESRGLVAVPAANLAGLRASGPAA
ncbi:MAG: hypothetical protein LC750_09265 [Actinobacteria bacterium]|nr:hypothetical protein [Actinomycetota bacterium]